MLALIGMVPWRWWLYGAIVAGALGVVAYYHHEWVTQGYNSAIEAVTHANDAEKKKADGAQYTVDQCYAAGGNWNRDTGVCDNPAR